MSGGTSFVVLPRVFGYPCSGGGFVRCNRRRRSDRALSRVSGLTGAGGVCVLTNSVPRVRKGGLFGADCLFSGRKGVVTGREGVRLFSVSVGKGVAFGRSSMLATNGSFAVTSARFKGVNVKVYCSVHFPRLTQVVIRGKTLLLVCPNTFGVAANPGR